MKKNIIIDTDIGADCDDMIALVVLLNAHKRGDINLALISLCTKRSGAVGTAKALLNEYGLNIPVCQTETFLKCDGKDNYASGIANEYEQDGSAEEAVESWKKLYESDLSEITPIVIGPLTNLADFINEYPDLFYSKTEEVYLMMGNFDGRECEWNTVQNLEASINVINNIKCGCYILPSEEGFRVLTGKALIGSRDNVVGKSVLYFYNSNHVTDEKDMLRQSWDPLTVSAALNPELFDVRVGDVTIDGTGKTTLKENGNGHFGVLVAKDTRKCYDYIEDSLNEYLTNIKQGGNN